MEMTVPIAAVTAAPTINSMGKMGIPFLIMGIYINATQDSRNYNSGNICFRNNLMYVWMSIFGNFFETAGNNYA
jgi:hypothetical protein